MSGENIQVDSPEQAIVVEEATTQITVNTGDGCIEIDTPEQVVSVETRETPIEVSQEQVEIAVETAPICIELEGTGPQGPAGPTGGEPFKFVQEELSDRWVVVHNLGRRPASRRVFVDGCEVDAKVLDIDNNIVNVCFAAEFTGCIILI